MIAYKDDLSFTRIVNRPRRNMGERRMAFLREMAEATKMSLYETLVRYIDNDIFKGTRAGQFIALIERFSSDYSGRPVSEVLSAVLDESGYETALRTEGSQERLDNLAELKQSVYIYETTCGEETTLEDYLRHAALFSNSDADAGTADKVRLMTIHTAKGLEFPYVFLCGMNEGIFPSRRTRTLEGMEEERRLAFVALTRARKGLYLSEAQGRNFDGSPRYPSRFVLDIDPALISFVPDIDEDLIREAKASIRLSSRGLRSENDTDLLQEGDRIRHRVFGPGTIRGVDRDRSAYIIRFDDMDTDRRITFRAKIEKM
jgi:DNA helicase-2/ATP-dependent DNA helicase PcrA